MLIIWEFIIPASAGLSNELKTSVAGVQECNIARPDPVKARKMTGCLVKDIARHFQREPMTISEASVKIESLLERDRQLAKRIVDMKNNLMKRGKRKYLITVA